MTLILSMTPLDLEFVTGNVYINILCFICWGQKMCLEFNTISNQFAYLKSTIRFDYFGLFIISLLVGFVLLSNYELHNRIVSSSHAGLVLSSTYN